MIRKFLTLVLILPFLAACGRDDGLPSDPDTVVADTPQVEASVRDALFSRIDANSIYLFANTETLPESLSDKLWDAMGPVMEMNAVTYSAMEADTENALAAALLRELAAIDSRQALEERGLHGNGLYALHALSLYPVMNWQLIDADAFSATISRIAEAGGVEPASRSVDGEEMIWLPLGDMGLAIHYDEHFVTLALVPDDTLMLRRVVNLDQPTDAYLPRQLNDFNAERGYTPQGSGFLDFAMLIERLLDADDELMSNIRNAMDLDETTTDPACVQELRALTTAIPRKSFGYTRIDSSEFAMSFRLETSSELGEKLARIADSPVSLLEGERAGMFSFGLALNLVAARDFGRELVAGWVDSPPQCSLFANIAENAEQWQLTLNQPIPPVVTNLQGFRVNIDRLDIENFSTQDIPDIDQIAGTLALYMRNPQMMLGMAQMFSPDLAALDLRPGADPQPLPPGLIPNMPELQAWIAMGENAIGLALGEDQEGRLAGVLKSGIADNAVLHYGIDGAAYAGLMGSFMEQAFADMASQDENVQAPPAGLFQALAAIYDYSEFSMELKAGGIEFNSRSVLAD